MSYKDPDKQRAFQLAFVQRRRLEWIESQGGKCVRCGSTERLEVDHINREDKAMNPRAIWSRRQEARDAELAKCQVLCNVCHKAKTRDDAATAHGTIGRYNRGCRCDECRECNNVRVRQQRANKRIRDSILAA